MAQWWWSLRYPLVDGQGNFGSMDGDIPLLKDIQEVRRILYISRAFSRSRKEKPSIVETMMVQK